LTKQRKKREIKKLLGKMGKKRTKRNWVEASDNFKIIKATIHSNNNNKLT